MKTIKELKKLIGGEVKSSFDYSIDKDRRFRTLFLITDPTVEQVNTALDAGYELVARTVCYFNDKDELVRYVGYEAVPVNGEYEFLDKYQVFMKVARESEPIKVFECEDYRSARGYINNVTSYLETYSYCSAQEDRGQYIIKLGDKTLYESRIYEMPR